MTTAEAHEAIEQEKRGLALLHAALSNAALIEGTMTAFKAEVNGAEGKPWSQVKAELQLA